MNFFACFRLNHRESPFNRLLGFLGIWVLKELHTIFVNDRDIPKDRIQNGQDDRGNKEGLDPFINFISIDDNVEKKFED